MFAVIAENDESQWSDDTGTLYHFPKRYIGALQPGTQVIYYKGGMTERAFAASRLSTAPHYFGIAKIGTVHADPGSRKGDLFATIEDFLPFAVAVLAKEASGAYYEQIPPTRTTNYWRDGVRTIGSAVHTAILEEAGIRFGTPVPVDKRPGSLADDELESASEGNPTLRYVTTYERDGRYRRQALAIHGYRCAACDVDMSMRYGEYAKGLIHVHHVQPVSTYETPRRIDPAIDLVPVCPNCHAVIHRRKEKTLSIAEVRSLLAASGT